MESHGEWNNKCGTCKMAVYYNGKSLRYFFETRSKGQYIMKSFYKVADYS